MAINQCRGDWIRAVRRSSVLPLGFVSWLLVAICPAAEPIHIGSRLELFVDDYLIDTMAGAELTLHEPVAREIALDHNAVPWEGNTSLFHTVFQDGPLYRMYYRGTQCVPTEDPAKPPPIVSSFFCYAESDDGVHWRRPELGLVEFQGSSKNNILWSYADSGRLWDVPDSVLMGTDDPDAFRTSSPINFTVFKDTNPDCPPDARYKLMGGSWFGGPGPSSRPTVSVSLP